MRLDSGRTGENLTAATGFTLNGVDLISICDNGARSEVSNIRYCNELQWDNFCSDFAS
jgi:hypothetical protein